MILDLTFGFSLGLDNVLVVGWFFGLDFFGFSDNGSIHINQLPNKYKEGAGVVQLQFRSI
ncbi:MAG: hypothetical protein NVS1B13_26660 [Flavisolibacter sp.]